VYMLVVYYNNATLKIRVNMKGKERKGRA
jgi:hypothetical protein